MPRGGANKTELKKAAPITWHSLLKRLLFAAASAANKLIILT
jgi:hypothetical protein